MSNDWIVVDSSSKGLRFLCQRCKATEDVIQPIPIPDYLVLSDKFIEKHRSCKETDHERS